MKIYTYLFLGLIAAIAISCDKKEENPTITIEDLVGSWNATSFVFTNKSDANVAIDLVVLGAELRFTMLESGGVRTWFELDTISDEWDSQATLSNGNTLTLTPVEVKRGISTFEVGFNNNTLELTDYNASFDFTLEGGDEVPATSVASFESN